MTPALRQATHMAYLDLRESICELFGEGAVEVDFVLE
jgi:hypothetical protein